MIYSNILTEESVVENLITNDIVIMEVIDIDEHMFLLQESFEDFKEKVKNVINRFVEILENLAKKAKKILDIVITKIEDLIRSNEKVKNFINKIDMSWSGTIRVKYYETDGFNDIKLARFDDEGVANIGTIVNSNSLLTTTESEIEPKLKEYVEKQKSKIHSAIEMYDKIDKAITNFEDKPLTYHTISVRDLSNIISNTNNLPINGYRKAIGEFSIRCMTLAGEIKNKTDQNNKSIEDEIKNTSDEFKSDHAHILKLGAIINKYYIDLGKDQLELYKKELSVFEHGLKVMLQIQVTNAKAIKDIQATVSKKSKQNFVDNEENT